MSHRNYELILFGATGFTGQLAAEYLATDHLNLKWAIAGRDLHKLEDLRKRIGHSNLPILIAESEDEDSLVEMAKQTKVIISTVGPYARYGSLLLNSCAREGTHYCDLTGEAQWMAEVYENTDALARESGARLVHSCGFDSIPSDLAVHVLQKAFKERFGCYASSVSGRMGHFAGGVSGGTIESMMLVGEQASRSSSFRKKLINPYLLYPPNIDPGWDKPDQIGIAWDDHFDSWTAPFLMAGINTKVVRRSHALLGLPYGKDFRYEESQLVDNRAAAIISAGLTGALIAAASFGPARALLRKFLPNPGEGPNSVKREAGFFEFWSHGIGGPSHEHDLRVKVSGKRDPGYGATSRMLVQAGLCLVFDQLTVNGGIWTPASAFGDWLVPRLDAVDIKFEISEKN